MRLRFLKGRALGTVSAPTSKSMAHRLLISAAMAEGKAVLSGVSKCEDVLATVDCLRVLGSDCQMDGDTVTVTGSDLSKPPKGTLILPCRESGSTIRFLLPIACLSGREVTLCGAPSLLKRPMKVYEELCRAHGMCFSQTDKGITVKGPLQAGTYTLAGNVSSQFVSGMLFALTQTAGESIIKLIPPVESRSYILLTVSALCEFGAQVEWLDDTTLRVEGGVPMKAHDATVEGDYSNAAFLEAFNLFEGDVKVGGLQEDSLQGDRVYRDCFQHLVTDPETPISLRDCPDLAPILFSVAAAMRGGRFTDTKRLKIKESDRAEVMAEELRKFGTRVIVEENSVRVIADAFHAPDALLYGHNDHRVVMSLAVLASVTGGEIDGCEAVTKSYPAFFADLRRLGIRLEEIDRKGTETL